MCFFFYTVATFGSLTSTSFCIARKACTLALSVVWFGHELSARQWAGAGALFFGLALLGYDPAHGMTRRRKGG